MRRKALALAVAVLLAGGALATALRPIGERALSSALENNIRSSFGFSKEARVGVRADFRSLLGGRLDEIRIKGGEASAQGIRFKRIEGRFQGLGFDPGAFLAGQIKPTTVSSADLKAEIPVSELNERLPAQYRGGWSFEVRGGRFFVTTHLFGERISIPLKVSVEKNAVLVRPEYAFNFFRLKADVPSELLPCGLQVSDLRAGENSIVLEVKK